MRAHWDLRTWSWDPDPVDPGPRTQGTGTQDLGTNKQQSLEDQVGCLITSTMVSGSSKVSASLPDLVKDLYFFGVLRPWDPLPS